jgi:hypothetical protein
LTNSRHDARYFSYGDEQEQAFLNGLSAHLKPEDIRRSIEQECRENDDEQAREFKNTTTNQVKGLL